MFANSTELTFLKKNAPTDQLSHCRPFSASFPPPAIKNITKFAVFITGASRTFGQTWPSIQRTWLSEPNADLYVVVNVPESPQSWDCLQFLPLFMHPGLRYFALYRHNYEEIIRQSEAQYGSLNVEQNWSSRFLIDQGYLLSETWIASTQSLPEALEYARL